jgi:lipopolysaccharide transport system ATP-binding protein
MKQDIAIKAENISKIFSIDKGPKRLSFFKNHPLEQDFYALKDINFEIIKGDSVGLIGRNGSGKSTLLKILGGITYPTTGKAYLGNSCSIVMDTGIGFHKDLSGYENIFTQGQIMGLDKNYIKHKLDEIIDFSEIEDFIYTPIKHYSSGMVSRLSFSVIAMLSNNILMIDEVLGFGDIGFHQKAIRKMKELHEKGRTILTISHNLNDIITLSNRILVLRSGKLIADGLPTDIIPNYIEEILLAKYKKDSAAQKTIVKNYLTPESETVYGPDDMKLLKLSFSNQDDLTPAQFQINNKIEVQFSLNVLTANSDWDFGIIIRDITENVIFTASARENEAISFSEKGIFNGFCYLPANIFNLGKFFIYPYFANLVKKEFIPIKDFISFRAISKENKDNGINKYIGPCRVNVEWESKKDR